MKGKILKITLISAFTLSFSLPDIPIHALKGSDQIKELQNANRKRESLVEEIARTDATLKQYTDQIQAADRTIKELQEQVKVEEVKLAQARDRQKYFQELYNQKMVQFYEHGQMGYLSQLLKTKTLKEFFQSIEALRLIGMKDAYVLREHKKATKEVNDNINRLNALQNKQQQEVEKVKQAFQHILEVKKNQEKDLANIDEIIEDYEDEVIDINRNLIASGRLSFEYKGPMIRPSNGEFTSGIKIRWGRMHEGHDYAGSIGDPYWAAADGVVVESRVSSGYGWLITIYHGKYKGKDLYTRYAHSYKHQVLVTVGQEVRRGQIISKVGHNGRSTGPHLHFEVRLGSGNKPPYQDPADWISN